jgi:large conductance mechanosensitive channel
MKGDLGKEFKAFILRGNVVDLAVGVVIGAAFGAIVTSLVQDVITPALGLLNLPDFGEDFVKVGDAKLYWGKFVNAMISFVVIAAAIFFFVVKPVNHLMGRTKQEEGEPKNVQCPHCLSSIPREATVCAYCTREVVAKARTTAKAKH